MARNEIATEEDGTHQPTREQQGETWWKCCRNPQYEMYYCTFHIKRTPQKKIARAMLISFKLVKLIISFINSNKRMWNNSKYYCTQRNGSHGTLSLCVCARFFLSVVRNICKMSWENHFLQHIYCAIYFICNLFVIMQNRVIFVLFRMYTKYPS